jgi:hypothetical protein
VPHKKSPCRTSPLHHNPPPIDAGDILAVQTFQRSTKLQSAERFQHISLMETLRRVGSVCVCVCENTCHYWIRSDSQGSYIIFDTRQPRYVYSRKRDPPEIKPRCATTSI